MLRTFDVMTVPKLNNKIKRYIKGPLTFLPQTEDDAVGVVREIPYTCGNVYIGETGRRLLDRKFEHRRDFKYYKRHSPLVKHNSCNIKIERMKILRHKKYLNKRKLVEADIIESLKLKYKGLINISNGLNIRNPWG